VTPGKGTVLVVDDEPQMLDIVSFALETQGFDVVCARDAERAWTAFQAQAFCLAVLDVMLPRASGIDLCRRMRAAGDTPIILLTARTDTKDRILGLEAGADDYVTKPFHPRELALRAEAVVRRSGRREPLEVGDLRFEDEHLIVGDRILRLPSTELRLLTTLAAQPERSVSYADLTLQGWRMLEGPGSREMLKTAVYRLRGHLREAGSEYTVTAERGIGYALTRRDAR
jgi:DNA-binding response OmpR family regulator